MLVPKQLHGQGKACRQEGYAMAALLVALSVMAILMTAAMPVWKHMAQREKEEELVFRGKQYARAIGLFQRRAGPGVLPPSLDILVEQKFLRKKYKDPITNGDFDLVRGTMQAAAQPGQTAGTGSPAGRGAPGQAGQAGQTGPVAGRGGAGPTTQGSAPGTMSITGGPATGPTGGPAPTAAGISGVVSKSKDMAIRLYNGKDHYNEWFFVYTPPVQAPGAGAPGAGAPGVGAPGQRGAQPQNPGGRSGPITGSTPPGGRGPTGFPSQAPPFGR
jgi:type II secretory pathway pseudopilin PulG